MIYSTRRFVLSLAFFLSCVSSPFSIAITSLGEERANRSAFHLFVQFALDLFCLGFLLVSGKGCGLVANLSAFRTFVRFVLV